MKIESLVWYPAPKEELPEVAFGAGDFRRHQSLLNPTSDQSDAPACVAFSRDGLGSIGYRPPALFMLKQKTAAETMSWLRVYSKDAFPLSQFARVITDSDLLSVFTQPADELAIRTDKWASVIVGEMLAQAEGDADLDNVPLSRALGCFSSTVARASHIHDSFAVTRACTERLRFIADDPRFSRRAVTIDSMLPIWSAVSANLGDITDPQELTELILHTAELAENNSLAATMARNQIKESQQLFSDSVEERVVAFQRLAGEAIASGIRSGKASPTVAALIGVGAFLVGRGTSHAFLLKKFPAVAPLAFVWFGLAAALRGVRGWDTSWLRLTKGVERQLRTSFNIEDPPAADICWAEFAWLAQNFNGPQVMAEYARTVPRGLSIEVVPGAVCQFRLAADGRSQNESERRVEYRTSRDAELRQVLEQVASLSSKAKALLDGPTGKPSTPPQASLGFEDKNPAAQKGRAKKLYRRTDK